MILRRPLTRAAVRRLARRSLQRTTRAVQFGRVTVEFEPAMAATGRPFAENTCRSVALRRRWRRRRCDRMRDGHLTTLYDLAIDGASRGERRTRSRQGLVRLRGRIGDRASARRHAGLRRRPRASGRSGLGWRGFVIARGGRGGRGTSIFPPRSTLRGVRTSGQGQKRTIGSSSLIADVGIIGFPTSARARSLRPCRARPRSRTTHSLRWRQTSAWSRSVATEASSSRISPASSRRSRRGPGLRFLKHS